MTLQVLDRAAVGLAITRSGISFMPIYLAANKLPEITTGRESGVVLDELESASVPTLMAHNPTDRPALIVEGEHFLGGQQDRTVNVTVIVPARAKLEIPVSCLERGRWGRKRDYSRSAAFAARSVRRTANEGVHASMEAVGSRRGDQGAVWDEVDSTLRVNQVRSETDAAEALHEVYRRDRSRAGAVDELTEMGPLPGQCGLAVTHGQRIVAIELFGAPHLLAAHWGALVRSYMLETPDSYGYPSTTRVLRTLVRFGRSGSRDAQGVGMGRERRVRSRSMTGQALLLEDSIVHASIFTR